jgi:hypothetical protein
VRIAIPDHRTGGPLRDRDFVPNQIQRCHISHAGLKAGGQPATNILPDANLPSCHGAGARKPVSPPTSHGGSAARHVMRVQSGCLRRGDPPRRLRGNAVEGDATPCCSQGAVTGCPAKAPRRSLASRRQVKDELFNTDHKPM